jgi:hypothetical protein
MKRHPAAALIFASLSAAVLWGCYTAPTPSPYAKPYPTAAVRDAGTLDIQVVRNAKVIGFTNTTAREFGPSTVWVNRWYSRPIDGLKVGETVSLPLDEFKDVYSDTFRAGGFFAKENPDVVVLCELESTSEGGATTMYGLVVVKGTYE